MELLTRVPPTVAVTTLGCRLNQFESDAIERQLVEQGYRIVDDHRSADVCILNSCTITHHADNEARQWVRRVHREAPQSRIVVTGCYATASPNDLRELPGVALVLGNEKKETLVAALQRLDAGGISHGSAAPAQRPLQASTSPRRSRAYLKIQDGCDYRCAFCIVPAVRGKSRSHLPEQVLEQMQALLATGVCEVVLTGVHLGTYGRDLSPRLRLTDLLNMLLPHLQHARLRLSSLDPHEVDDTLIALLAAHPRRLCRSMHLPVQSAHNDILRLMRRAHTVEDLTALVPRLVQQIPGVNIGSDVIVGFPQETDAYFDHTYAVLESLPLAYLHVFSYSRRQATAAATMPGHVTPEVIATRSRRLRALSARKRSAFIAPFLGEELEVVVHRRRHPRTGELVGVTDNFIRTTFSGPDTLLGRTAHLRLVAAGADGASGVLT